MALEIRTPPHLLSELRAVQEGPAGEAVLQALRVALEQRLQPSAGAAQSWTLEEALAVLDPQERTIHLFAALRLLEGAQPGQSRLGYSHLAEEDAVRIDQQLLLEFARTEVTQVEEPRGAATSRRPTVTQNAMGLLGPNGPLPYTWTEFAHDLAHSAYRAERDGSFVAWLNVIQRRQIAFLYRAWSDSVAVVGADRAQQSHPLSDRLRALAGLALAGTHARDSVNPAFKSAFAAVLSRRVRSPQPLEAMLGDYFELPVRVEEFVPRWLGIPRGQRTALGVQFTRLGEDAVAGDRVWDCATKFRICVGPMDLARYRDFLPHGSAYAELGDLVALYAGPEFEWDLVPILQRAEVPYSWLGNQGLLLGWSSWLGVRYDATDAADLNLPMAPDFGDRAPRGLPA